MPDDYENIRQEIANLNNRCRWPERGSIQLLGRIVLFIIEKIMGHRSQMVQLDQFIDDHATLIEAAKAKLQEHSNLLDQAKTILTNHEARIKILEGR